MHWKSEGVKNGQVNVQLEKALFLSIFHLCIVAIRNTNRFKKFLIRLCNTPKFQVHKQIEF